MTKHIIGQSVLQLIVINLIMFGSPGFLYETEDLMQQYAYGLVTCYNVTPHPVSYNQNLTPANMYLISGFESLFANTTNSTFTNATICQGMFPDTYNLKNAYDYVIDVTIL